MHRYRGYREPVSFELRYLRDKQSAKPGSKCIGGECKGSNCKFQKLAHDIAMKKRRIRTLREAKIRAIRMITW
jgi:hypothetical protein